MCMSCPNYRFRGCYGKRMRVHAFLFSMSPIACTRMVVFLVVECHSTGEAPTDGDCSLCVQLTATAPTTAVHRSHDAAR